MSERGPGRVLPNFLIIGAMKAGTTTLYDDLSKTPGVYMPPEKEPNDLASPDFETAENLAAYARKFAAAGGARAIGEASTAYAKRPDFEGVAERALRVLGPDLKIIYVTRDPIRRLVSQFQHEFGLSMVTGDLDEVVLSQDRFINYSRYAYQLEPWRQAFPDRNILVMRFEDYLADRPAQLGRVRAFLGLEGAFSVGDGHRNQSAGKRFAPDGSIWSKIMHSKWYLYGVKHLIPVGLRDQIKSLVLPVTREAVGRLRPDTEAVLRSRLTQEDLALCQRSQDL